MWAIHTSPRVRVWGYQKMLPYDHVEHIFVLVHDMYNLHLVVTCMPITSPRCCRLVRFCLYLGGGCYFSSDARCGPMVTKIYIYVQLQLPSLRTLFQVSSRVSAALVIGNGHIAIEILMPLRYWWCLIRIPISIMLLLSGIDWGMLLTPWICLHIYYAYTIRYSIRHVAEALAALLWTLCSYHRA